MNRLGDADRSRRRALVIFVLVATLVSGAGTATAGRVADSVRAQLQRHGRARVIVELAVALPETGRRDREVAIEAEQHALIQRLAGTGARVTRQFRSVPFIAMEVDGVGLSALERARGVVQIQDDAIVPPTLFDTVPLIGADSVWPLAAEGSGWAVAVLDTGVDRTHPFLAGRVVAEACFSGNGNCPNNSTTETGSGAAAPCTYSPSECLHGTHVTGIAAGRGDAFSGVARGADIVAVQVFSQFTGTACNGGPDPCARSYMSDQIAALEWVDALSGSQEVASVNISIGGGRYFSQSTCDADWAAEKAAIDTLRASNIPTVIAAGNDGFSDSLAAPGCISSAVSVGCTSKADGVCAFSDSAPFLSLWAPGLDIFSSVPGGGFDFLSGTSMSAPHVAGAWVLLRELSPTASVSSVLTAIRASGLPITDSRNGLTIPRLQVRNAVIELLCGNGVLNPGEQCDDGNRVSGDGCDANCTLTACGNGIVTAGEQCDDGNTDQGDGCKNDCTSNVCGDRAVWRGVEGCDDGNTVSGDGCSSTCDVEFTAGSQIDGRWVSHGPEGGVSTAIAVDPVDPSIVYVGTGQGDSYGAGVFKSTDGGATWNVASSGLTSFAIDVLSIDPANRSTLYAGTQDGRIFKTTDAAATWQQLISGLNSVYGIAIDPSAPNTVYAGVFGQGVLKTTDGGANWAFAGSGIINGGSIDLAIDPSHPSTVYASVYQGGVFKTIDGGSTWTSIVGNLPTLTITAIELDPTAPTTLYAATQAAGVFKSTDGGSTWSAINTGLTELTITAFALAPSTPTTLYAGTFFSGVFRTTDGGASWTQVLVGLPPQTTITGLAVDPVDASTVYTAPFVSGVYKTTDAGGLWKSTKSGLTASVVTTIALDPARPTHLYAGVFQSGAPGLYRSVDGGAFWTLADVGLQGQLVQTLIVDPTNTQVLYAGTGGGGVYKTASGGMSWGQSNVGLTNLSVNSLAIDPTATGTIYAGTGAGVFATTNAAGSWSARSNGLPSGRPVHAVAVNPATPSTLFAGVEDSGIFKSTDGGATWTLAGTGFDNTRSSDVIVIDPTAPTTAYAGTRGAGVFKTIDGGQTWVEVDGGITGNAFDVRALAIDPSNPGRVYRGSTGGGVHWSSNAGATWTPLIVGLNALDIRSFIVDPFVARKVYAGGYGGGVFRREAVCGDGVTEDAEQCDQGAANGTPASCCTTACGYASAGTACTGGTCDGAGTCGSSTTTTTGAGGSSTTSTTATSSSTTTTTLVAPCTNGALATKPRLTGKKLLPPPGDDGLSIKGAAIVPTSPALDPPNRGVRLLLTGATGAILFDVTIPPGAYDATTKSGWVTNGANTAWTYKSPGTSTQGIQKVQIKLDPTASGAIKFTVKGKNGVYPVVATDLPVMATLVLDVPTAAGGQCVELRFPAVPPTSPSCTLIKGATLKCK
jgi:cysteine-rich repeat protein